MAQDINSSSQGNLEQLSTNTLLPERPAIVSEFSPAYEADGEVMVANLPTVTQY